MPTAPTTEAELFEQIATNLQAVLEGQCAHLSELTVIVERPNQPRLTFTSTRGAPIRQSVIDGLLDQLKDPRTGLVSMLGDGPYEFTVYAEDNWA